MTEYKLNVMVYNAKIEKYELMTFTRRKEHNLFVSFFCDVINEKLPFYLPTPKDAEILENLFVKNYDFTEICDNCKIPKSLIFESFVKYVEYNGQIMKLETAKSIIKRQQKYFDKIENVKS